MAGSITEGQWAIATMGVIKAPQDPETAAAVVVASIAGVHEQIDMVRQSA